MINIQFLYYGLIQFFELKAMSWNTMQKECNKFSKRKYFPINFINFVHSRQDPPTEKPIPQ